MASIERTLAKDEKAHYETLERLRGYALNEVEDPSQLVSLVRKMISEWRTWISQYVELEKAVTPKLKLLEGGDKNEALFLYLILGPFFMLLHALRQLSRHDYRSTVTAAGIFSERIIKNLLLVYDLKHNTSYLKELEKSTAEDKNGRLKSILEKEGFKSADTLYSSLKKVLTIRNRRGPHDVPPPEPIQAKICINEFLPIFMDYLDALIFLGIDLKDTHSTLIEVFNASTEIKISAMFPEAKETVTLREILLNLYREKFFKKGRSLNEVIGKLNKQGFNYHKSTIANALRDACNRSRKGFLTRKRAKKGYVYFERLPPEEYFKTAI